MQNFKRTIIKSHFNELRTKCIMTKKECDQKEKDFRALKAYIKKGLNTKTNKS